MHPTLWRWEYIAPSSTRARQSAHMTGQTLGYWPTPLSLGAAHGKYVCMPVILIYTPVPTRTEAAKRSSAARKALIVCVSTSRGPRGCSRSTLELPLGEGLVVAAHLVKELKDIIERVEEAHGSREPGRPRRATPPRRASRRAFLSSRSQRGVARERRQRGAARFERMDEPPKGSTHFSLRPSGARDASPCGRVEARPRRG
mmetsp:Transcript_15624/g.39761  ORF Transcript_15624/g.39761 Transcript_15624/m.39761 type:complete len:201 (+) Transcript_15624:151-753(+)